MVYVRISGRFSVNIAVLTGSETIGNYNAHAIAKVGVNINGNYREYEVPVITGNALKHWHAVYLAEVYKTLGGNKSNELCDRGIGLRGYKVDATLGNATSADSEAEAIEDLCNDIHGFLIAEKGKQIKRDSLAKFSFAAPVFTQDVLEVTSRYAETHNRVDPRRGGQQTQQTQGQQTQMMIFKQEYSSSPLYGFNVSLNLAYVCKPIYESANKAVCDDNEISLRRQAAVLGILSLLTGFGSKQARALPITEVKELIAAVSKSPIPNIVHGSYEDYVQKSLEILKAYAITNAKIDVLCYGLDKANCTSDTNVKVNTVSTLKEFFDTLVSLIK